MRSPEIDLTDALARLSQLTVYELRTKWRRHYRMSPPMRLSRDLLMRGVSYRLQERTHGGLSKAILRKIESASFELSADAASTPPSVTLKPGTRLIREWRGERYRSLSEVARAITGAHWSGPRFFGLRRRSRDAQGEPRQSHTEA